MSRITGTDAFNMMEAYNAIYAPQELTEEQVWEEVEAWVNSLVEEGYDLSEYTWEDMYEEYLNEMGQRATTGQMTAPRRAPVQSTAKPAPSPAYRPAGGGMGGLRGSGRDRTSYQTSSSPGALRVPANAPYQSRFAGARDAAFARARQIQGSPVVGPRVATPAAAPARPVAQAPARPAAAPTGGVAKPTTTATTAPAATPAAPRQRDTSITDMIGRSQIRQGAPINTGNASSDIRSRALRGTEVGGAGGSVAAPVVAAKPSAQQQIRQRRLNMDLDLFDIVKGYLIDEGYAETEEAAAVIMANMSEEWKESILESGYFPTRESQMKDEAKHNLRGQTVKPRTAQTQAKPTPSNLK